jgi:sigma-E factor negative regulatory protein RseB
VAALLSLALLLPLLIGTAATAQDRNAEALLERMRSAAASINYVGVFVYRRNGQMETIRIVHRVSEDGEQVRLTSLNGAPREILRDHRGVTCVRSDHRSVLVNESRGHGVFPGAALRTAGPGVGPHYRVSLGGEERVAGRPTREVRVEPTDAFRYGLRLWLDNETGLVLKSTLLDGQGQELEQFMFTSIEVPATIPAEDLAPEVSSEGFAWQTTPAPKAEARGEPAAAEPAWMVGWVPPGFAQSAHSRESMPGVRHPVEHLVFTDGLAAFSIYLERVDTERPPLEGASRVGAMTAYATHTADHQVTVLGEVPVATVERVARSVARRTER